MWGAVAVLALLLTGCAAPIETVLSTGTVDPGAMCVPRGIDQANTVAIDIIRNVTDGEVLISGVALDSPAGMELLSGRVQKDLSAGGALTWDGKDRGPFQPTVLAPDEEALIEVVLKGTAPEMFGTANGLWVTAETPDAVFQVHTCFKLLVAPGGDCGSSDDPGAPNLDGDMMRELCGRTERI